MKAEREGIVRRTAGGWIEGAEGGGKGEGGSERRRREWGRKKGSKRERER